MIQKTTLNIIFILLFLSLSFSIYAFYENRLDKEEYEIKEDSVWIETSNGKIFGLLFSPIGVKKDKIPAMLLLQGGGDIGLANYLYEAKFFAKNGIAALVCDKSGSGLSKTKKNWTEQSFKEKTNEYFEIFTWLSNYAGINKNKIGVHGMSEGGRLALNLVAEYPSKIAFANAVSGPIDSFKENQLYGISNLYHSQNLDSAITAEALEIWDVYFNEIAKKKISNETVLKIENLRSKEPALRYFPLSTTELPSRPLPEDVHFSLVDKIKEINCPILFQYGEWDTRVDPVRSVNLIPKIDLFEIKVYPKTDHSMNLENGNMYPLFLEDKKEWILRILEEQ
jgi:dienelactone hydrolase